MDSYSSEDGASPKRLKANDQSSLPVSILKDNVSSEAEDTDSSERRKSRKSIGRRVSFAPTAHVRMFEIPEEKQQNFQGSAAYVMPDISSQTGIAGFSLGPISTIEETSMASNDSFDVSVRHSDPSESTHSSEDSFLTEHQQESTTSNIPSGVSNSSNNNARGHISLLDSNDADDDSDSDDDDDSESDGDVDDAVTMELTGAIDGGAMNTDANDNDEDSSVGGIGEFGHINQSNGTSSHGMTVVGTSDADSFLNMLLQGNNTGTQDTSLLDNILSQFESTQQFHTLNHTAQSAADTDYTRVGLAMDDDNETRDVTMHDPQAEQDVADEFVSFNQRSALPFGDDDMNDEVYDETGSHGDPVTMDLTGIVVWPPPLSGQQITASESEARDSTAFSGAFEPVLQADQQLTPSFTRAGAIGSAAASVHSTPFRTPQRGAQQSTPGSLVETLETLIARNPSPANNQAWIAAAASPVTPERALAGSVGSIPTPTLPLFSAPRAPAIPATHYTPQPAPPSTAALQTTPRQRLTPRVSSSSSNNRLASVTPTPSRSSTRARRMSRVSSGDMAGVTASALSIEEQMPELQQEPEPTFKLDALPVIPFTANPPRPVSLSGPPTLADHARAGLVFGIFDAYRQQELVPKPLSEHDLQATYAMMFEPLFRKAKLTARLEYCSSLASLFEVDRNVSQVASATPTDFAPTVSYFEDQNSLLAQRKEELLLRISKTRQRLMADAPNMDAGGLAAEISGLKSKLVEARRQREAVGSDAERLSSEIQALQTTGSSFDRQVTERKSAQNILLAINGLQLADVAEDRCDFVYDKFAKLHLDTAAEFTSLHPDIDWAAVVKDNSSRAASSMRQDAISAMKTNAAIKELLEDVKRVKRHTFVDLSYNDGIQVRIQFFSKTHRRRFYLQISIGALANYKQLYKEARFDWATEVVYGEIDSSRFKLCLRACKIDSQTPLFSIYQHVEQLMDTY
ncbi:hypothetical protein GGI19_000912 [Coemansia pectinata]|uniref:Spc7 kinetochore protein domain-containing protein n=1 Tax=Coemansia pectinata TaxID=1052879 RepID=A0A9W8GYP8_9FUNG|nr:hypothetical protein GGI19_000912 [Coemansia pectinata]